MSEQFTLPNGATGLKIDSDGTRYGADKHGHIHVDNPNHVAEIKNKANKYIQKSVLGFGGMAVERCVCGFAPHNFSVACPRCKRKLK